MQQYHTQLNLPHIIAQTLPILYKAGAMVKEHFDKFTQNPALLHIDYKSDASPVTEVDKSIELWMRQKLSAKFKDFGIIGEEFGDQSNNCEFSWIIDPIDGTKTFITGVPLYTSLLGLIHTKSRTPLAGFIYAPSTDELVYAGVGLGAHYQTCYFTESSHGSSKAQTNGKPNLRQVYVSQCTDITKATLLSYDINAVYRKSNSLCDLCMQAKMVRTWADGYAYLLLATGRAHAVIDPSMHLWDILPVYPIIIEAGGCVSTWPKNELQNASNKSIAAPLQQETINWQHNNFDIIASCSSALLETIRKNV